MKRKELGEKGENLAAQFLEGKGYFILEHNFRCPLGEIDLIAKKDGELIFVEVKTRKSQSFGTPAEAVDRWKEKRLIKCAQFYVNRKKIEGDFRIDVIGLEFSPEGKLKIEHLEDALG